MPWSSSSRWRPRPTTFAVLLGGLWLFGTGEAALIDARLGNSPWTVLAQGLALRSPLSIGGATFMIGALVMLAWIPLRERPGLGTVFNVVLISLAIDVMLPVLPSPDEFLPRLIEATVGIAAIGMGSALYLTTHLGPGPRDGWMTGLHRRTRAPLAVIRTGIEAGALGAGWLLGGQVGLGTALVALLIGPAVASALRLLTAIGPAGFHEAGSTGR